MDFLSFRNAVHNQFTKMAHKDLFYVDVSKAKLWEFYLKSFPKGANPIFIERTEHDCQTCKRFIRSYGGIISIDRNLNVQSIWDINIKDTVYNLVSSRMSKFVKSRLIENRFFSEISKLGVKDNHSKGENGKILKWDHFYFDLPKQHVFFNNWRSELSHAESSHDVFERGLNDISIDSMDIVFDLINQNSLYRGEEHYKSVFEFYNLKKWYDKLNEEKKYLFCWKYSRFASSRIRNTVIGTLLLDISNFENLDKAVDKFTSKVAPENYKRPKSVITTGMIKEAEKKVKELGIEKSLNRRYAIMDDITINNVLFVNREVKKSMGIFDELLESTPANIPKDFSSLMEMDAKTFVDTVIPKASALFVIVENTHEPNFMSLIAPKNADAPNILKWDNNFSWTYNGEVTDSIKRNVKKAGGDVNGVLRFSIQWNEELNNQNDFDAHCIEPNKNEIYYPKAGKVQRSSGVLDVDIVNPGKNVAVENITWSDKRRILEGEYIFLVHNYNHNGGKSGFKAEIEYEGNIYSYEYNKELRNNEKVIVAKVNLNKKTGLTFINSINSTVSEKEIWGVKTNTFAKVSMVMNSPNHWDFQNIGNKHLFFILDGCINPEPARGFYNEFLKEDLTPHRKTFEVLGNKLKTEMSNNQLSGVGFSMTKRDSIYCKVSGTFNRIIKINF